ncbi:MAG: hypothetical protein U5K77_03745 [Candidatus Saccharibacteria bacterium]|nr:hypothetical protein [Candidatus Saccharibacteria bacterium]
MNLSRLKSKRFQRALPLADAWRPILLAFLAVALLCTFLLFRLSTLTPGFGQPEIQLLEASRSFSVIADNPLFLPNKVGVYLLTELGIGDMAGRVISVGIGVIAAVAMFLILRQWHTPRVSILATSLFITSSWFLNVSRIGTEDSAYLLTLLLVLSGVWLHKKRHVFVASIIATVSAAFLLYVPAMSWLVLAGVIWQRKRITAAIASLSIWWQSAVLIMAGLILVPLGWGLAQQPTLALTWLGLPQSWPTVVEFIGNVVNVPKEIFLQRAHNPIYGIGRLPYLDIFTTIMVAFGVYSYAFRLKLDRTRLILAGMGFGVLFVSLADEVRISLLLPFIYILAAAGITLLLQKWFTVFPKNPLARGIAVAVMIAAIMTSSFYHITRYYEAWPNTPETKQTFQQRP